MKNVDSKKPIGVIESLLSGFDLVSRHPELMVLPVVLDVFLWLGPHLSAYPLFRAVMETVRTLGMTTMDATMRSQTEGWAKALDQAGQTFNLFTWLSPRLLGVPSLMAGLSSFKTPTGLPAVWYVKSTMLYLGLFLAFSLAGLGLSAIYWGLLSSRVGAGPLSMGRLIYVAWGLFKVALLFMIVGLLVIFPTMLVALILAVFNLLVAQLVTLLGMSFLFWILFYMAFTLHGVALRQEPLLQAVQASIGLMRTQFLSTMGLIILVVAIYFGLAALWNIPPDDNWVEVAAILVHAFVATGLATATALYYLDRAPDPRPVYEGPELGHAAS